MEVYDEVVYSGNEFLWFVIGSDDYFDFVLGVSVEDIYFFFGMFIDELFEEEMFISRWWYSMSDMELKGCYGVIIDIFG